MDPKHLLTNAGARGGDAVVLTKPLGTGVIATALKAGKAPAEAVEAATRWMSALNAEASVAGRRHGARAATDVTGFGLAGHAAGVARESRVSLEIRVADLPLLPGALELAKDFQPGGLRANRAAFEPKVSDARGMDESCARSSTTRRPRADCCCSCRSRRWPDFSTSCQRRASSAEPSIQPGRPSTSFEPFAGASDCLLTRPSDH